MKGLFIVGGVGLGVVGLWWLYRQRQSATRVAVYQGDINPSYGDDCSCPPGMAVDWFNMKFDSTCPPCVTLTPVGTTPTLQKDLPLNLPTVSPTSPIRAPLVRSLRGWL